MPPVAQTSLDVPAGIDAHGLLRGLESIEAVEGPAQAVAVGGAVRVELDRALAVLGLVLASCEQVSPPADGDGVSLLTHTDVVTLFHEFGHMLHHLLTRVDFPSVSGINGVPWDAVELPSQFMENFAWNYDVLTRCSSHYETGEPLPRDLFDKLDASRHAGAALAMLRQIELGLFDFRIHTEYDPDDPVSVLQTLDGTFQPTPEEPAHRWKQEVRRERDRREHQDQHQCAQQREQEQESGKVGGRQTNQEHDELSHHHTISSH